MKKFIKKILRKVYLDDLIGDLLLNLKHTMQRLSWYHSRNYGRVDRQLIKGYFKDNDINKLHIGCGGQVFAGWLNSDIYPVSPDILHLEATTRFPFDNNHFDYLFSEHMIEHITFPQGAAMLSECFRVLKPGGKLRIATPNLAFVIDLYGNNKTDLQKLFIENSADTYIRHAHNYEDTFVINNYVRAWGHQFIYDEKILRNSFETAGFTEIQKFDVGESEEPVFRHLENEQRKPAGLLNLESLVLEGTKP